MSEENKALESQVEKVMRFHRLCVASVMSNKPLTENEAIELNELENKFGMLDTHEILYSAYYQAQAEIEKLKARMARARKLILADLKASPDCECGADNGSNYTDVICYRHAALMELK